MLKLACLHAAMTTWQQQGACGLTCQCDVDDTDLQAAVRMLHQAATAERSVLLGIIIDVAYAPRLEQPCDLAVLRALVTRIFTTTKPYTLLPWLPAQWESDDSLEQALPDQEDWQLVGLQPFSCKDASSSHGVCMLRIAAQLTEAGSSDGFSAVCYQDEPLFGSSSETDRRDGASSIEASHTGKDRGTRSFRSREASFRALRGHLSSDPCAKIAMRLLAQVPATLPVPGADKLTGWLPLEVRRFEQLRVSVERDLCILAVSIQLDGRMDASSRAVADAICADRVPAEWQRLSYPTSERKLSSWMEGLCQRVHQIQQVSEKLPAVIWIGGLFSPQAFFASIRVQHALQMDAALPEALEHTVLCCEKPPDGYEMESASVGCYVSGLSLQGASWDADACRLAPALELQTSHQLPVVHLLPRRDDTILPSAIASKAETTLTTDCPVYTTRHRVGAVLAPSYNSGCAGSLRVRAASDYDSLTAAFVL